VDEDESLATTLEPHFRNEVQTLSLTASHIGKEFLSQELDMPKVNLRRFNRTELLQEFAKERLDQLFEDVIVINGHQQHFAE
jgi:hypothetical protein